MTPSLTIESVERTLVDSVTSIVDQTIHGTFTLGQETLTEAPEPIREILSPFAEWTVFAYGIPIRDEVLWVWHHHGEHRTLFANYLLELASRNAREGLDELGITAIDVPRRFGRSVSLVELGERAGLGRRGINRVLLHPEYGGWLQLHALLVDLRAHQPPPEARTENRRLLDDVCISCLKCIKACPAQAIEIDSFSEPRCSLIVAAPSHPKSKAVALTADSYVECAECISVCPIGKAPERIYEWRR